MLIELHLIQNYGPANLNRDDLGAPKTCVFGGVTRARISSQCLKRSIRRSPQFAAALEKNGGVRTRRLVELIAREAAGEGNPPKQEHLKAIRQVFEDGGVSFTKDDNTFDILFFLPQSDIKEMAKAVLNPEPDLGAKFAEIIRRLGQTPDIALCGRMTEFDAKGHFKDLAGKFTVEAALSAAHAISTHAVINEVDYFTAADDVPGKDAGAAHVNEAMFNSACFYKHFVIDFNQLVANLGGDTDLALTTVQCFIEAAVVADPSGKQHAYAAFNRPDGVLVELKAESSIPSSYANAFADPVPEKSERGLIGESIARMDHYAYDVITGYGIQADRLWFSPNLRHRLEQVAKAQKERGQASLFAASDGELKEFGEFSSFVNGIMNSLVGIADAGAA